MVAGWLAGWLAAALLFFFGGGGEGLERSQLACRFCGLTLDLERQPPSLSIQMYSAMIFPFWSRAMKGAS